ncbi:MAG: HEAT repeat domain-containing protein [Candidatus Eiseniibacteriota bacterium]|nr:MAG: HEAT repeat domain-containing protein [Candidatus Eisenbacteria bacterium]
MVDERVPLSKTLIDLRIKELEIEEKARVISELKSKRDEASIKELVEKLADDSWHLRQLAARALSEIGKDVEHHVMEALPGSLWFTRACAAEILGNVRSRAALDCLIDLLEDSNSTVKEHASKALLQICDGGDTVWAARAAVSKGGEVVGRLKALFEKFDRELADGFLSMTKDAELMKAPVEQVEKIAEEMSRAHEPQDLVWEELTKADSTKTPVARADDESAGGGTGGSEDRRDGSL